MSKKSELFNLFKGMTGKTAVKNVGASDDRSQAAIHKKYGYQTANLKEYFR